MKNTRRPVKALAVFCALNILVDAIVPSISMALTNGPNQPEASGFTAASSGGMVDPFTGDFKYNIPLLDVGGYPIAINYAGGVTPDQEATWVGLGWNLSVGGIKRQVRGIADDYAGDEIKTEHTVKPNRTYGLTFQPPTKEGKEIFTFKTSINRNYNIFYNNYTGFGFSYSYKPSFEIPLVSSKGSDPVLGLDFSPNFSIGSEDGVGISPSLGLKAGSNINNNEATLNANVGFPFSSREGAKGMSLSASFSGLDRMHLGGYSNFIGFSTPTFPTVIQTEQRSTNITFSVTPENVINLGKDKSLQSIGGYYNEQKNKNKNESSNAYGYLYEGSEGNDLRAVLDFNREKESIYRHDVTTNMPVTNHTYDIFNVSGEGISGSFRAFRNDVVTVVL